MAIRSPFVLFVGPTKSGTTWINAYLEARGDIALPTGMKETFFFDKVYERGIEWYDGLFPDSSDTRMRVEVAPSLFHKPVACERAVEHLPFAKIVCVVRDPFDRAVSHYFHYRKRGAPKLTLQEMASKYPDVIGAGLFSRNVAMWEQAFGASNVHLISYQLLRDDPNAFCQQLCDVMEIDFIAPDPELSSNQVNAAKVPRSLIAARVVQWLSTKLRRIGAHRVVNILKRIPIKRWLYSGGDDLKSERQAIVKQSVSFSETLSKDWQEFQKRDDFPTSNPALRGAQ